VVNSVGIEGGRPKNQIVYLSNLRRKRERGPNGAHQVTPVSRISRLRTPSRSAVGLGGDDALRGKQSLMETITKKTLQKRKTQDEWETEAFERKRKRSVYGERTKVGGFSVRNCSAVRGEREIISLGEKINQRNGDRSRSMD